MRRTLRRQLVVAVAVLGTSVAVVRAAATDGRFVSTGGSIQDTVTRLEWQPDAGSFAWSTSLCVGAPPWRLPSVEELETLVDERATTGPRVDAIFSGTTAEAYWTSTVKAGGGTPSAWTVNFSTGAVDTAAQTGSLRVKCVKAF